MEALLLRYGLVMVFVGTAVEGDVTMMLAGVTAHLGLFHLADAMAVGAVGGFVGDVVCYGLGRWHATTIRSTELYRRAQPAIERFTARFGPLEIIVARFIYGTRVASMVFWGVQRLPLWRFILIDAIGCVVWAAVLGALGFTLSDGAAFVVGRVKRVRLWLFAAFLGCAAIVLIYRALLKRRAARRARASGSPS